MIEDSQHAREGTHRSGPDETDGATDGTRCGAVQSDRQDGTALQDAPLSASAAPAPPPTSRDTPPDENGPCAGAGEDGEVVSADPSVGPPSASACPCSSPATCTSRIYARGVCRTAYRKLSEAGLPIGDDRRETANASRGLAQLAHRLSSASPDRVDDIARRLRPDARERLAEALARASGRDGRGGR